MIKPGDKIQFSSYIPYDYLHNRGINKKVTGEQRKISYSYVSLDGQRHVTEERPSRNNYPLRIMTKNNDVFIYKANVLEGKLLNGIFCGHFYKKLKRLYRALNQEELTSQRRHPLLRAFNEHPVRYDRYSTNPRRLDNPRKLDKIALVKYHNKLLAVPFTNILKCTYKDIFKTI